MLLLSGLEGGGQLLRTSLSLSLITGKAFHMTCIRGARPKPGLMRQHLTCVNAAAEICGAAVEGAHLGSQELKFHPGPVRAGDYQFAIGSGGATTLVLQTLLPALLHAPGPSTVRIEGGTHNPLAPPFEFIEECFLPVLHRMGVKASVTLGRPGFMQSGGGFLKADVLPMKKWKKLDLHERGELVTKFGTVLNAHLDGSIVQREVKTLLGHLGWEPDAVNVRAVPESTGPGNIVMLGARFEHITELSSSVAQMGRSAEQVGSTAAKGLIKYLENDAPVGVHLADQLLLPLALAGKGSFTTFALSRHTMSNMALIPKFLEVAFEVEEKERGMKEIGIRHQTARIQTSDLNSGA
ncbi:RNA 3'-terminal phosphate cyclase [Verrucomicrobium spinosum]|uniref:RNA 3'-terminal phosphate cyclase n=1 Tax=Verrucomicrobium spinosum TaxID=2736 RepID=UPI0001746453|nr:RNA 3'-terminal phosphate cyclase [Verrucomicrobium spinosum]